MKNEITVIIPNWNGKELLQLSLSSLYRQIFKSFDVIVVDNNSNDHSVQFIKSNFPEVEIVKLDKNYGFASAINAGVKQTDSKYVVFLNNDTEVDPKWLEQLFNCAKKQPEVASVCSKLLNF